MHENYYKSFAYIFMGLILIPILLTFVYSTPCYGDDIDRILKCSQIHSVGDYLTAVNTWLNGHNGRYTSAIIALIPFAYEQYYYGFMNALLVASLFFSFVYFFNHISSKKHSLEIYLIVFIIILLCLTNTRRIPSYFFNLAFTTVYIPTFSFLLFGITFWSKNIEKIKNNIVFSISIFFAMGSLVMTIIPLFVLFGYLVLKKGLKLIWALPITTAVLSMTWIMTSSSNHGRTLIFPYHGDIYRSFTMNIASFVSLFSDIFLDIPNLILLFIAGLILARIKKKEIQFSSFHITILLSAIIFLIGLVYLYGKGWFVLPRIYNLQMLYLFLGCILIIAQVISKYFSGLLKTPILQQRIYFLLLFVFIFKLQGNQFANMYQELFDGKIQQLNQEVYSRNEMINNSPFQHVVIPDLTYKPASTFYEHLYPNPQNPPNKFFSKLYGKKTIKVDPSINMENFLFKKEYQDQLTPLTDNISYYKADRKMMIQYTDTQNIESSSTFDATIRYHTRKYPYQEELKVHSIPVDDLFQHYFFFNYPTERIKTINISKEKKKFLTIQF